MTGHDLLKSMLRIAAFWLFFGLFSIFSSYVYYEGTTVAFEWQKQLLLRLPSYLLWILFTPVIFAIADTFALHARKLQRVLLLAGLSILIALLHRSVVYIVSYKIKLMMGLAMQSFGIALQQEFYFILSAVFDSLFICVAILVYRYSANHFRAAAESRQLAEKLTADLHYARLQALQMHLQPHFLFNTLHAISSLVYTDPEKADMAISLLSQLLRKSLDLRNAVFIPLAEELELSEQYLAIQKIRFAEKFHLSKEIQPEALGEQVPVFILQPLLENVMKHSVEKASGIVNVQITASVNQEVLLISITENGKGFQSLEQAVQKGYGLQNVIDRLAALPEKAGNLTLTNAVNNESFSITIKIPRSNNE